MIVIDASSLAKFILKEEGWSEVKGYLTKGVFSIDHSLLLYSQIKRLITERIIILEPEYRYIDKALDIALKCKMTIYDSLYIAQALRYGELLTSDKRQAQVAEKFGVKVIFIP